MTEPPCLIEAVHNRKLRTFCSTFVGHRPRYKERMASDPVNGFYLHFSNPWRKHGNGQPKLLRRSCFERKIAELNRRNIVIDCQGESHGGLVDGGNTEGKAACGFEKLCGNL